MAKSVLDLVFVAMAAITVFVRLGYLPLGNQSLRFCMPITLSDSGDIASVIKDSLTAIAILVGGVWALSRFWRERESVPRLQLDLEVKVVHKCGDVILLELIANIENKGKVRHEIRKFDFEVSTFSEEQVRELPPNAPCSVATPVMTGSLMPSGAEYSFIEPGVRASYAELICVSAASAVVYVYSRFEYGRREEYHEAEYAAELLPGPAGEAKASAA